jgi:hypothetical protein
VTVRLPRQLAGLLVVGFVAVCTSFAWACDVPVFRYALEYWPAAPYEVNVLYRAPLLTGERDAIERLGSAPSEGIQHANVTVRLVDLAEPSGAGLQRLWRDLGSPALPLMALQKTRTPQTERPIWSGPLTVSNARMLVDSPARREIVRRILEGHSAVWVLLESGDSAKDSAARALLEKTTKDLERKLELPVGLGNAPLGRDEPTERIEPPLQIRFSLLSLSRSDAAESVFIDLLLHSEKDLGHYPSEPIAFPIYGRGRALYALVGKGITEENIREACVFLVGACSCQAKALNPGTDLLMAADWDARLVGSAVQAAGPQPLVGLGTLSKAARIAEAAAPARKASAQTSSAVSGRPRTPAPAPELSLPPPEVSPGPDVAESPRDASAETPKASASVYGDAAASSPAPPSRLLRNMLLAVGAIVAVTAFLGALVARRRPDERP